MLNKASEVIWKGNDENFRTIVYDLAEGASGLRSNDKGAPRTYENVDRDKIQKMYDKAKAQLAGPALSL